LFGSGDRQRAIGITGLEITDFRIFADGADEDDFVDATSHGGFLSKVGVETD
jgi:hypothetical protein